jgi:hypothetical protein
MFRNVVLAAVAAGLVGTGPTAAQEPKQESKEAVRPTKPAGIDHVLQVLRSPGKFEGNVNEVPLFELLQFLSKRYDLTFVILEDPFRAAGEPNVREKRPNLATTSLDVVTLRRFLDLTLGSMNATYLVRKDHIAIVPIEYAARETQNVGPGREDLPVSLKEPLVSAVYKEKPLTEAVADLAEEFDLNVVVGPQAADARAAFVSARLLNVPADQALELLAVQADLRVVRKGKSFLVTSKDHADALFAEQQERERQQIELEKFRKAPPAVPVLPAPIGQPVPPVGN